MKLKRIIELASDASCVSGAVESPSRESMMTAILSKRVTMCRVIDFLFAIVLPGIAYASELICRF